MCFVCVDIITKLEEALLLEPKKHVGIMDWFHGLRKSRDKGISSWGWNLNGQHSTYHALFPRAWTIYDGTNLPTLSFKAILFLSVYDL